jgi:hypothetical protein
VAGSRREYLAADKLKTYITVKLSPVTDACRGSDPNDRPKFLTDRTLSIYPFLISGMLRLANLWCGHVFYKFR